MVPEFHDDRTPGRHSVEAELRQRLDRQAVLLNATRAMVLVQRDDASLARAVFDAVAPTLGADLCFNYRFDEPSRRLQLTAGFGIPGAFRAGAEQLELGERYCGLVAETLRPGYRLHGRVLRPAMVRVAK